MKNHFNNFAKFVKKNYLKKDSLIIELGSNDGTFYRILIKKIPLALSHQKVFTMLQKKRVSKV